MFLLVCQILMPSSIGGLHLQQAHRRPCWVVPEILAEITNRIRHLFSLLVAFLNRETFLPVGARKRTHWV